ncbi:MAG: DUF3341 domain-containing protein [Deltaproteobacteria bacterium]|nr:DUF3341 domain-containing protein [Deltaproteobacteria bacterium]
MNPKPSIMGLFKDEDKAVSAIHALAATPYSINKVHSPIPSSKVAAALKQPMSKVGYFTLMGGIVGFFFGFGLAIFTATQWSLIVSGKPVVALVPFFIVGFECTILFAIFGNIIGFIFLARLPDYGDLRRYDPRCSGVHFGILADCDEGQQTALAELFKKEGGEVNRFEVL